MTGPNPMRLKICQRTTIPSSPQVFREHGTCVDLTYNMKHDSCGACPCGAAEGEPWRQREKNDRQVTIPFEGWLQLRRNSLPCDPSILDGLHLPLSSVPKRTGSAFSMSAV